MIMNDSFILRTNHRSSLNSKYHRSYHLQHEQKYNNKYETTVVLSTTAILPDSSRDSSSISVNNNVVKPKKIDNFFEKICLYILTKILSLYTHIPIPTSLHHNHHSIINSKNSSLSNFGSYDKFVSISKVIAINYYYNIIVI